MSADGKTSLCLRPGERNPAHLHLAFRAETRAQVEAFHRAALAAAGKDNGAPGLRPQYHAHYYAAFVIDPDGHNIEVVCHEPGM
jgi:catechol 2,3-dioxygenase-like lactoylglutathione lyase family enzyme